jgi:quinol monooxygenase YgiN
LKTFSSVKGLRFSGSWHILNAENVTAKTGFFMIILIATLQIKPGSQAAIRAAVAPCITATQAEAGCLAYDLYESVTTPETMVFVEKWESRAALAAHFETPHLQAWREAGGPFILSRTIEIIHPDRVETL